MIPQSRERNLGSQSGEPRRHDCFPFILWTLHLLSRYSIPHIMISR
jgi:hypothetical protein